MVSHELPRLQIRCDGLDALEQVARQVIAFSRDVHVWLFEGEMGAGKTTLIKSVCAVFGVRETVSSPTFGIVNEYQNEDGQVFYHFDCYRLGSEAEAMDIGMTEYLDSGAHCFVEWPSKISGLLPDRYIKIEIAHEGINKRLIEVTRHD